MLERELESTEEEKDPRVPVEPVAPLDCVRGGGSAMHLLESEYELCSVEGWVESAKHNNC